MNKYNEEDKKFILSSYKSGILYGYPKCCIKEFVKRTPRMLKNGATNDEKIRAKASFLNGEYTGFIPCIKHAKQILLKQIKLVDLIDKNRRKVVLEFPDDWSQK